MTEIVTTLEIHCLIYGQHLSLKWSIKILLEGRQETLILISFFFIIKVGYVIDSFKLAIILISSFAKRVFF